MESLEEVMKKYKLTDEEHNKRSEEIQQIILHDKFPVKNPKAIINIAPPASGKTGLNGYATEMFVDNNVVIINSDELKPFHPHVDEIAKFYPQYYTKVTDQESNSWTSDLFDRVLREGYNVIFEGTGRNARILNTIQEKMKNYEVIVRGMAVNELNCLTSILDRYENQVTTKGWGRLVTLSHFYETYNEMPNTIDIIEKSSVVDSVEIYKRGSLPHKPIKIYDSTEREYGRFSSAKQSILGGRLEDQRKANENFEQFKISDFMKKMLNNEETKNIFFKMKKLNEEYKKKLSYRDYDEER
jgi:UDP-N-acetylglucosamine kinase